MAPCLKMSCVFHGADKTVQWAVSYVSNTEGILWSDRVWWAYLTRESKFTTLCVAHNNLSFACCVFVHAQVFGSSGRDGLIRILGKNEQVLKNRREKSVFLCAVVLVLGKAIAYQRLFCPVLSALRRMSVWCWGLLLCCTWNSDYHVLILVLLISIFFTYFGFP